MNKFIDTMYHISYKLARIDGDKFLHFIVGLVVAELCCACLQSLQIPTILSLVPAFALMVTKETFDFYFKHELFDWQDVGAGMFGAMIGFGLAIIA